MEKKLSALVIGYTGISLALLIAGCASTPSINTSDPDAATFDGLYPVEGSRVGQAWARADLDFSAYDKIMLQGAGISFRPVKAAPRSGATGSRSEFPISEEGKLELRKVLAEAFVDELQKTERFEFVSEPGPDVLLIRAGLIDVVSRVPPETIGRSYVYLSSFGEATLVLEMVDSESETVLIRAVDRRAAETIGRTVEANRVTARVEAQRLARSWGTLLRTRLEYLADALNVGEDE
jgi:hypothetical protein